MKRERNTKKILGRRRKRHWGREAVFSGTSFKLLCIRELLLDKSVVVPKGLVNRRTKFNDRSRQHHLLVYRHLRL